MSVLLQLHDLPVCSGGTSKMLKWFWRYASHIWSDVVENNKSLPTIILGLGKRSTQQADVLANETRLEQTVSRLSVEKCDTDSNQLRTTYNSRAYQLKKLAYPWLSITSTSKWVLLYCNVQDIVVRWPSSRSPVRRQMLHRMGLPLGRRSSPFKLITKYRQQ